tara:strand:+ start:4255 stop:6051 length:1797 start_codon:yes stop_codon:yes gene_type:complete
MKNFVNVMYKELVSVLSNTLVLDEGKLNEGIDFCEQSRLTEAKLRKGDIIKMDDGEYGVVNKIKGKVAYIKLPSMPGSFHPIEADRTTYKGKHKGRDLYSEALTEGKKKLPKFKNIPSWARYVAQQSDGEWTWYEETPTMIKFRDGSGGAWKQDGNQTYTGVKTNGKDWDKIPTYYNVKNNKITESSEALTESMSPKVASEKLFNELTSGRAIKSYSKSKALNIIDKFLSKWVIGEGKLNESMIGIKTKANFKPLKLKGALEKAKIKGFRMDRLTWSLTALKLDKKYYKEAMKIIDKLGLSIMTAKEGVNEGSADKFLDRGDDNNIDFYNAVEKLKAADLNKKNVLKLAKKYHIDKKEAIKFVKDMWMTKLEAVESNNSRLNEAEKYITNKFKVGDTIKLLKYNWKVTEINFKPGKSYRDSFTFVNGKQVSIKAPPTNRKAVGYKLEDGRDSAFYYSYKAGSGKTIMKLVIKGFNESVTEGVLTEMDINDPILVSIRARKQMLAKAKAAPKQKKISTKQYYKLMDKEIDLIQQMKDAAKDYERLDSEMNQEAGQKGDAWTDADANRYGGDLNKLQTRIEKLAKQKLDVKKQIMNYRVN